MKGFGQSATVNLNYFSVIRKLIQIAADGIFLHTHLLAQIRREYFVVQVDLAEDERLPFSFEHNGS